MAHHGFKIFVLFSLVTQYAALFSSRDGPGHHHQRIRIHLEDDEHLIIPKHATIKLLQPVIHNSRSIEEFYPPFPVKLYKPKPHHSTRYLKHIPVLKLTPTSSFKPSKQFGNDCCDEEDEWKGKDVPLEELFRPVTLPLVNSFKIGPTVTTKLQDYPDDDVKPVTENIEDDLKYDFRTKTHSI